MEPAAFAAELISRLEKLKQEQETMDCLEERVQQRKGLPRPGPKPMLWSTKSFPRLQEQSSHQSIFGLCPWIIYDLFFTSDDHRSKLSISCSLAWSKGSPSPPFEITPFAIKSDCLKEV